MLYKYIYKNELGEEINFSPLGDIIALQVQGINGHEVDINTSKGINQIGDTITNTIVNSKLITMDGILRGNLDHNRETLLNILRPQTKGTIYAINNKEEIFKIDVMCKNTPVIGFGMNTMNFQISFYADYPYWKLDKTESVDIRKLIPMFSFKTSFNQVVGGRNLVLNSSFSQNINNWIADSTFPNVLFNDNFAVLENMITTNNKGIRQNIKCQSDSIYTLTFEAKDIIGNPITVLSSRKIGTGGFLVPYHINSEKINNGINKFTFLTYSESEEISMFFRLSFGSKVSLKNVKLEKNNTNTIWTPAWEDGLPTFKFSEYQRSEFINVENDGNEKTSLKIVYTAKTIASNPKLLNVETGEYIKLNYTFEANEIVTITTGYNNKKIISSIKGNIFKNLDLINSTFLQLNPGKNIFKFTADTNENNVDVTVYYDEVVSSI